MKYYLLVLAMLLVGIGHAQDNASNYRTKTKAVSDTVVVDTVSINPSRFKLFNIDGLEIDTLRYRVDYKKGLLFLSPDIINETDSVKIDYLRYPDFLTRDYYALDPKIIVNNSGSIEKLYALQECGNETQRSDNHRQNLKSQQNQVRHFQQ